MRLTESGLETYVAEVAELLERYGLELELPHGDLAIEEADGARRFAIRAFPPGGPASVHATFELRETWLADGTGAVERVEYVYELLDRPRDLRRAFHRHDADWFVARFQVVVHEHCERPIGVSVCEHHEGRPIRDAFDAVERLLDIWVDPDPPDCRSLPCLE